ncbi:unnamed protein product, partial [Citrullus colocynthis]
MESDRETGRVPKIGGESTGTSTNSRRDTILVPSPVQNGFKFLGGIGAIERQRDAERRTTTVNGDERPGTDKYNKAWWRRKKKRGKKVEKEQT